MLEGSTGVFLFGRVRMFYAAARKSAISDSPEMRASSKLPDTPTACLSDVTIVHIAVDDQKSCHIGDLLQLARDFSGLKYPPDDSGKFNVAEGLMDECSDTVILEQFCGDFNAVFIQYAAAKNNGKIRPAF